MIDACWTVRSDVPARIAAVRILRIRVNPRSLGINLILVWAIMSTGCLWRTEERYGMITKHMWILHLYVHQKAQGGFTNHQPKSKRMEHATTITTNGIAALTRHGCPSDRLTSIACVFPNPLRYRCLIEILDLLLGFVKLRLTVCREPRRSGREGW
jgi:hypothetical protein